MKIKMLVMDVDGTLTDGKIYVGNSGEVMKAFNVKDGYAIHWMLPQYDIEPVVITGRKSDIVDIRCKELGITEVHQGCVEKKNKMLEIAKKKGLQIDDNGVIQGCAYIGDDYFDLPAMEMSQVIGCPLDAIDEVKKKSDYICKNKAGDGAVREFIEWLIEYKEDN